MKNIVILVALTAVFFSCKKDLSVCKNYKEINARVSNIVPSDLPIKEMRDTLIRYPQLEVTQVNSNNYVSSMNCNVYYQNLLIFSDQYSIYKYMAADSIQASGTILQSTLALSLEPKVNYEDAVKEARKYINLDHSCISYQLGLYNRNRWMNSPANYRLAWKISDTEKPYIYVIIDAVNNSYIYSESGVYFVN